MKKSNRKGFTIVELVIVIAVIAILAAVLIPTFTNLIKKANESSDQQAVRQMNTILAAEGAVEKNNIFEVFDALHEAGLDAKNYKPLVNGTYFFWDDKADRVVYTDSEFNVIYPKGATKEGNWFSLTQTIEAEKPADTNYADGVTVANGAELLYVLKDIEEKKPATAVITIPAEGIDMMGAAFGINKVTTALTIQGENGQKATISNVIAVDIGYMGQGKTASDLGQYNTALFPDVDHGATLTITNVIFENIYAKNTQSSNVGLLVGNVNGTVKISNVEIKNSTVIGHRNVGALIGNVQQPGTANISGVTMKNVSVLTVGGRSGLLVGVMGRTNNQYGTLNAEGILLENCKYDIYACEQNNNGNGLQDGLITSKTIEADGSSKNRTYCFDKSALVSKDNGGTGETDNSYFEGKVTYN